MKAVLIILSVILVTYDAAKLPDNVPRCKFEDATCFANAVEQAIRIMKEGNKKINLIPIEPLHVTAINIDTGAGNFRLILNLKECDIKGLSTIENVKVESLPGDRLSWVLKGFIKRAEVIGDYKADGQILILPVQGEGKTSIVLYDVDVELIIKEQPDRFEKKGKKHMRLERFDVKFNPHRVTMNFENLFNGDKLLGDNLNTFINENWQDVFKEVQPALEESLGAIFLELTNRVFDKVNVDNVFL